MYVLEKKKKIASVLPRFTCSLSFSLPFLTPAEIQHKPVDIDRPAENKEREGGCVLWRKRKRKGKKKIEGVLFCVIMRMADWAWWLLLIILGHG